MKTLQGNTFLYFGDKNVSKVSGIWKALHISIYIAIAVNAFVTSMAAGNMFQTFKYNCILYCTDVVFEKELFPIESFHHTLPTPDDSTSESKEKGESLSFSDLENISDNSTDLQSDISIISSNISTDSNDVLRKENETVIFKNQSHVYQHEDDFIAITYAKIDIRKSMFPSNFWCNFVLGIALVTFIFATFCAVLLAICSKGGKGRENTLNRPQNMVYPIFVSSIILGALNLVASITVKNGMEGFCASFEIFTGGKSCSQLINNFTIHERQDNFYLPYVVLSHTFSLTVILFLGQLVVTFLRVIYAVDYQLYALQVDDNEGEHDFEIEDGQIIKERKL